MIYGYIVILLLGIAAFVITVTYQKIFTSRLKPIRKLSYLVLFTLLLMTGAYLRVQFIAKDSLEEKILSPLASPINEGVKTYKYITKTRKLESIIQPIIKNESGAYSIVIKNLKNGENYSFNGDKTFKTASLYKLWVMATVYQKIEDGNLSINQQLSSNIKDLYKKFNLEVEDETITDEDTISYSVGNALNAMITVSDNDTALLLSAQVGISNIRKFLINYGFTSSNIDSPPRSTASDIARFFEKLYKKELISQSASEEMLSLLTKQSINDRIPKYLPVEVQSAHKTGELGGIKNDAGIVFSQRGDYIIVLMSETENPSHAAEVEAKVSKAVWEYFNR